MNKPVSIAKSLTQEERDKAVAELESSHQAFLDVTRELSLVQWNFKPGPDRWSVAECAEHIALSENFLFRIVTDRVIKTPAISDERDFSKDDLIAAILQERSQKATSPEPIDPTKRPTSPQASIEQFSASRMRTIEFMKTTSSDLRHHVVVHPDPKISVLDAYQCILVISGHMRRHILQILEVRTHPNF